MTMSALDSPSDDSPAAADPLLPGEHVSFHAANGLRFCVREWGAAQNPPLVLLHGLRGFSATWRGVARAFSSDWRLIAIDQRGRGDSEWDPGANYYTDAYLADLEAIVEALALKRFVLVGHSMGGTTAYVYAARHPDRLNALVIEDIGPGSSASGAGAERIRREMAELPLSFPHWRAARDYWRRTRPGLGREALEQRLSESLRQDEDGRVVWRYDAAGISRTRLDPDPARVVDLWPVVERIANPTLVIRGERSDFCPQPTVEEMTRRNPLISSVTVPGASHYVHDDAPDLFNQHLRRFIERTQAASPL